MQQQIADESIHPMNLKKDMAQLIVTRFWSANEAQTARQRFEEIFQKNDYSNAQEVVLPEGFSNPVWIVELLKTLGAVSGSSEARRLIESGAVSIDDSCIKEFKSEVTHAPGMIVKVGKHRIYKIA